MPATGKTTVARALAKELQLSLATKDDLKELLYDELGTGDSEWSRRLGRAAYALIFAFCRELLGAGRPTIAEANFFAGSQEEQFAALPPHRTVQIHCHAPLEVLLERYAGRTDRHPGHLDSERLGELRQRFEDGVHRALALDGTLIELETSRPVDVGPLARQLRALLT